MSLTQILALIVVLYAVPITVGVLWVAAQVKRAFYDWQIRRAIMLDFRHMREVRGRRVS